MKKQISCLISAAILSASVTGLAAFEQTGDETVCFSGNAGEANTMVGIQVFASGKTAKDLAGVKEADGNYLDVIVYHNQVKTDSKGEYKFYIDLAKSGKYTAYVGFADGTELDAEDFVFVDNHDYTDVAQKINDMSATQIEGIIKENPYVLGLSEEDLKDIDVSGLGSVIEQTLNDTEFSENDRDTSWETIKKALFVQKLNDGLISDVLAEDDSLTGISSSDIAKYLDDDYITDELKENFTKRLNKASLESYKLYEAAVVESFVLATVQYPNGSGNVEKLLNDFKDKIGIEITSSTARNTWSKLSGKNYDDFSELAAAFEEYAKGSSDSGNKGTGGGNKINNSTGVGSIVALPQGNISENEMLIPIFDDIEGVEWAKPAIVYLTEKQILDGVGGTKFNPNGLVTREQLAKMVVGAFAKGAQAGENVFSDVDVNAWYAPFVLKANAAGIAKGLGDGTFGVGKNVTRQDMCVMIYNAAVAAGYRIEAEATTRAFEDDNSIADYAKEAVYALKECGAVNGMDPLNFAPYGTATRAQVAKIIYYIVETM